MKKIIALIIIVILFHTTIGFAEKYTNSIQVTILLNFTDSGSGMGDGALMKFSNDGIVWSEPEQYQTRKENWDLSEFDGNHTIYILVCDAAGNWIKEAVMANIYLDRTSPEGTVGIEIIVRILQ